MGLAIDDPDAGFGLLLAILDRGVTEELEDVIAYSFWEELLGHGDTRPFRAFLEAVRSQPSRISELAPLLDYVEDMFGLTARVREEIESCAPGG